MTCDPFSFSLSLSLSLSLVNEKSMMIITSSPKQCNATPFDCFSFPFSLFFLFPALDGPPPPPVSISFVYLPCHFFCRLLFRFSVVDSPIFFSHVFFFTLAPIPDTFFFFFFFIITIFFLFLFFLFIAGIVFFSFISFFFAGFCCARFRPF